MIDNAYDWVEKMSSELDKEVVSDPYNIAYIVPLDSTKYQTMSTTVLIEAKAPPVLRSIFEDRTGFIFMDRVSLQENYVVGEDDRCGKVIFPIQTSRFVTFGQFINSREAAHFCLRGLWR